MSISTLNNGDTGLQARNIINDLVTSANAGAAISGESHVLVTAGGTAVQNAAALQAAYTAAQSKTPYGNALSTTNRFTIMAAPGHYDFESTVFTMDTRYIDLVSLDGNCSIIFNSTTAIADVNGVKQGISVTTDRAFIKGIDVSIDDKSFIIGDSLDRIIVENCKGGSWSFGFGTEESPITISGTFINCTTVASSGGSGYGFGGKYGIASGTFIDCTGLGTQGSHFGQVEASGIFINCTAGSIPAFGKIGIASGTFTNCIGGASSFGGTDDMEMSGGPASGTFTNCVGRNYSFAIGSSSGKILYCRKTNGNFQTPTGGGVIRYSLAGTLLTPVNLPA